MAMRAKAVQLVQQTLEHPFECIKVISKYVVQSYTTDIPYSHIWTSYIANEVGLANNQAPLTASCDKGANWFRRRKRYKLGQAYGGDYIPCPGDYIYFSSTYEQADATDVGIVLESDGTFVTIVYWSEKRGCPRKTTQYLHNDEIIGYGIPEYEDVRKIEMPDMATKGDGVAIIGEETYVHIGPDGETARTGTLKKGHAVEVLGITPTGWLKVVWGLSATGYAFVDNTKFIHKVIKDEIPYPRYEGFAVGDKVQFKGGALYKHPSSKGKSKFVRSFVCKIDGFAEHGDLYHVIDVNDKTGFKGWVAKNNVDFIPEVGYNKCKGEISVDRACLRVGPGREFTKVQKWPQMAKGNVVDILGIDTDNDKNEWALVVICGVKGYVEDYCINYIIEA